ncbi:unnamed protein product [Linum tenue]|uniref:Uncharacterized protein n=1 Tax=Linum tenue TaxID=586396 RepID=A0AAV0MDZ0_9ROSI|nr:unnamed protein product [Linum tenue]
MPGLAPASVTAPPSIGSLLLPSPPAMAATIGFVRKEDHF